MTFDRQRLARLEEIYTGWLGILPLLEKAKKAYTQEYGITKSNIYDNPFERGKIDDAVQDVAGNFLNCIKHVFTAAYPNVVLDDKDFRHLIGRDGATINFKGALCKLEALERDADRLATVEIDKSVLQLLPSRWGSAEKTALAPADILVGRVLKLRFGGAHSSPWLMDDAEFRLNRWLSVVLLGQKPSTAMATPMVRCRAYKNGRFDAMLKDKETAQTVAKKLCDVWNARRNN